MPVKQSSIAAVICKYQARGYCGFFNSVLHEEAPELTIAGMQLRHLASTLHC